MNPFKPKRTFESVVRELVTGLEDGSIVLSEEGEVSRPAKANDTPGDLAQRAMKMLEQDEQGRRAIERIRKQLGQAKEQIERVNPHTAGENDESVPKG